ncbi:type II toxin-antitoxin system VapC family toxin [Ammonicoccus fulvus]|uniref:Ribonuclease VapC n=1 Tax=Ammonicoccus fulvus TaxID=3138240 RepID=A0ABZ3FTJ8_9ACTN
MYFDTSAIVPLLVQEPTTETCRRAWTDADRVLTSRIAFVEVAAALAMAERQQRLDATGHDKALSDFKSLWGSFDVVEISASLARSAAGMARDLALRGYDAVHCAAAAGLATTEGFVAAANDARLNAAWHELGVAILTGDRL